MIVNCSWCLDNKKALICYIIIVEEGINVSLVCKATGMPKPTVLWRKALELLPKGKTTVIDGNLTIVSVNVPDSGAYACSAKNLQRADCAIALVTVIDRLKFNLSPPINVAVPDLGSLMLNCKAQGSTEITWKRNSKNLSPNHVIFPNGTFFLKKVTINDAGSYTYVVKNYQRIIEASCVVEVLKPVSCSSIKSGHCGS